MKKITTSKKVLWISLFFEIVLLVIIILGWFNHLENAYQFFFGDVALIIATLTIYGIKALVENKVKISNGINLVPDIFTALSGVFQALNSGDITSALSTITNTMQMIIMNHPELSQKDMPTCNNQMANYNDPSIAPSPENMPADDESSSLSNPNTQPIDQNSSDVQNQNQ
jgi:hypothetical protein